MDRPLVGAAQPAVKRKGAWRRALRSTHAWTGFVLCLLLAAMGLSGSLLLFKDDIRRLTVEGATEKPVTDPVRLGVIMNEAQRQFGDDLRSLRFGSEDFGLNEAFLKDGGGYLDSRGKVVSRWAGRRPLDWFVEFHHRLLLDRMGATIIGILGLIALGFLVSGLVLWWPMRRMFRPRPFPARNRRPALLATHRDLGVLLSPLLLLSILTGIPLGLSGISQPLFGFSRKPPVAERGLTGAIDWRKAISAAVQRLPEGLPRQISVAGGGKPATIRLRLPTEWNRQGLSMAYVSPKGEIIGSIDAEKEQAGARVYARLFPLHSGQVNLLPLKLLLLLEGLGLTLLSILGAEAFRRRLAQRL